MLVIRRKLMESVIIEEGESNGEYDIEITPVKIIEGVVRLAVKAPERKVLRKEIVDNDTGEYKGYSAGVLALGRSEQQSIIIDNIIEVRVTRVEGSGAVRLGVAAPKNCKIHRK